MKKRLNLKSVVSFFAGMSLALVLFSCSDFSSSNSGSISFSMSSEIARAVTDAASSNADSDEVPLEYKIEFSLKGDYKKSHSETYTQAQWDSIEENIDKNGEEETFTFKDIPVGSKVRAEVVIYVIENGKETPLLKGQSEEKKIEEGENSVSIKVAFIEYSLVINFYLKNGSDYELSEEYSTTLKTTFKGFNDEFGKFISKYETQYQEKNCIILDEKTYIPNESKITDAEVDSDKQTITINYYLDPVYLVDGKIVVEPPVQKYTLAKNEAESSKVFCLNKGTFIFSLNDENGKDVLSDVDWTSEENSSLFKHFVEFKIGNNNLESKINFQNNEISISSVYPLERAGTYNLTITVSPLAKTYVNTSGETVAFPNDFEPLTGMFEIEVENKIYYEQNMGDCLGMNFDDGFGGFLNQIDSETSDVVIRLFGETDQSYTTVLTTIKNRLENFSHLLDLDCSELTTSDPSKVVSESAMEDCSYLITLILPDDLVEIDGWAFAGCFALESVIFPADSELESIGKAAFERCKSLKKITLPNSLVSITPGAFSGSGLEIVEFAGNVGTWYYAFSEETKASIEESPEGPYPDGGGLLSDLEVISDEAGESPDYNLTENGITTIAQKIACCAKISPDEISTPVRKTIYLWRKTE